ncbi:MAG: hypothetical protein E7074_04580 [Bacteroidales bacterium]|nr:hypothetical protein [Bacteroidales bacterium]
MHKRPTQEEITSLRDKYKKDRLFQNLHPALSAILGNSHSITPEEIWDISLRYVDELTHGENDLFEIDSLPNNLRFYMAKYKEDDLTTHIRSEEDLSNICFSIELVMLYQLTRYQNSWEHHPYFNYCVGLLSQIKNDPRFLKVLPIITETNDRYETIYKNELEPIDYVPTIIKDESIIKEAIQLSVDCREYLASGYDIEWIERFWVNLIHSEHREETIKSIQSQSKYVFIYRIIGFLHREKVFLGNYTYLANTHFTKDTKPSSDSVRKYISQGADCTVSGISKYVTEYVSKYKSNINSNF